MSKSDFDSIYNNAIDAGITGTEHITKLIDDISKTPNIQIFNKLTRTQQKNIDAKLYNLVPSSGIMWMNLFEALQTIRIKNDYRFGSNHIRAVSFGRPNYEVIDCMANNGGCGLGALFALGIISYETYIAALCNSVFLNPANGTIGNVLYNTMINIYINESISPNNIYIKQFTCLPISGRRDDIVAAYNGPIVEMINYLQANLSNNAATILRFGDYDPRQDSLSETDFGHSVVVFKNKDKLFMFDVWVASLLILKNKDNKVFTYKSMAKAILKANTSNITPIMPFDKLHIVEEMELVGHFKPNVGTIFELLCINGDNTFEAGFKKIKLENLVNFMKKYKTLVADRVSKSVVSAGQHWMNRTRASSAAGGGGGSIAIRAASPATAMNRSAVAVADAPISGLYECVRGMCKQLGFMGGRRSTKKSKKNKSYKKHNKSYKQYKNKTHKRV